MIKEEKYINEDDMVDVYSAYEHNIYLNSYKKGIDYKLPAIRNGRPRFVPVLWRDIVDAKNVAEGQFVNRKIRFAPDIEEQALKQLHINFEYEDDSYTREEIQEMLIHPTDETFKKIVAIKDKSVLETFHSELIALENSNDYIIGDKVELYIEARIEELEKGIKNSQIVVDETKNAYVPPKEENEEVEEENIENEEKEGISKSTSKGKSRRGRPKQNKEENN